jgi:2'-5' RNA ligase
MIYNIALTFEETFIDRAIEIYEDIGQDLKTQFNVGEKIRLHATLIKFESERELEINELKELVSDLNKEIIVRIHQIRALPAEENATWIELSLELTEELKDLHENILERTKKFKIISGIKERYRPHITLAKTAKNSRIDNSSITKPLNKFNLRSKINIGISEPEFKIVV